jgi:hypothetical protein
MPFQQPRKAAAATRLPIADNGVMISFTGVSEDSRATIKTTAGEFAFSFSEVPVGKVVPQLNATNQRSRAQKSMPTV